MFVGGLMFLEVIGELVYNGLSRPRPYGVPIIGGWAGYASASPFVAVLTFYLLGIVYCLAVPGRARSRARAAAAATVAAFAAARLYLGVDHPDDVLLGAAFAAAIAVTAFGYFTPDEVFPVAYRRGRTAHVDVTGRRGEAIRRAVADQLGLDVTQIKPVGLDSSAGLDPAAAAGPGRPGAVRVRQAVHQRPRPRRPLVQARADHRLRHLGGRGPVPDGAAPGRIRGLCPAPGAGGRGPHRPALRHRGDDPQREYLLVTEFFKDAVEIGQAQVDNAIIDQGLLMIRRLWEAGLAHRDIKPGNLMVRCGELLLIDVCFVQVRPSPWRQAVDLGNISASGLRAWITDRA